MKLLLLMLPVLLGLTAINGQTIPSTRRESPETIEKLKLTYTPEKRKFKFDKKRAYSPLLDTNAVYVSKILSDGEQDGILIRDSMISFMRFYNNGICFLSLSYTATPDVSEYRTTDYGTWGMYKVNGNKIIIEHYIRPTMPPHFHYNHGIINGNKIEIHKIKLGRFFTNARHKVNGTAEKLRIDFENHIVNWR